MTSFIDQIIHTMPSTDIFYPLGVVCLAILLDLVTRLAPALRNHMRPFATIPAFLTRHFESKLNRSERGKVTLFFRGFFFAVLFMLLALSASYFVEILIQRHSGRYASGILILLLFSGLNATRLWPITTPLITLLKEKKRQAIHLPMTLLEKNQIEPPRAMMPLDQYGMARFYAKESVNNLHRGLVNPIFWYLLPQAFGYHGLAGFFMSVTLSEAIYVLATRGTTRSAFAKTLMAFDGLIHFIPARITAIILWLSALFTPSASPFQSIKTVFLQSHTYYIFNDGWPIAAMAGALNLAVFSGIKKSDWIAPPKATAKATWTDVKRAFIFHLIGYIICILILACLVLLSSNG